MGSLYERAPRPKQGQHYRDHCFCGLIVIPDLLTHEGNKLAHFYRAPKFKHAQDLQPIPTAYFDCRNQNKPDNKNLPENPNIT